jgi:phospholipase/carboxylesterase
MFNRVRSLSLSSGDLESLVPDLDPELLPVELRELYDSWSQSDDCPDQYSGAVAESDWPLSIFIPERYEERYAYPLVIWFHSDSNDEDQLEQVMSAVSSQNYIGLALRGNGLSRKMGGHVWDAGALQFGCVRLLDLLHWTTCRLRQAYHIHSERIFVAGSGHGADVALQTIAQRPDWFAGAILLDPAASPDLLRAERATALRGKPVKLTMARSRTGESLARGIELVRLLRASGSAVDVQLTAFPFDPTGDEARAVDHWIMDTISREALV